MNRAVGALLVLLLHFSQGVALGWYELTPLASWKIVQTPGPSALKTQFAAPDPVMRQPKVKRSRAEGPACDSPG
jgi:hypothetical protein